MRRRRSLPKGARPAGPARHETHRKRIEKGSKKDEKCMKDAHPRCFQSPQRRLSAQLCPGDVPAGPKALRRLACNAFLRHLRLMSPSFDSAAWALRSESLESFSVRIFSEVPEEHVYGLLPLLMCREVIREEKLKT